MGLVEKILAPVRSILTDHTVTSGYKTFTEYSPSFSSWDGNLYQQAQTRAIIERIAVACSKLKPEFVTPEGSGGALPRVQRMFAYAPNDMMSWPDFLRRVATLLYVETTAYVIPEYDARDGGIVGLWPLKPSHAEVVEYDGEPWIRFMLISGDVMAFPFYDVAILTRFQLTSDIFGGGNMPLTPTLRLMDAQRQAEEVALKTGANIRFIGKVNQIMHDKHMQAKRKQFADDNLNPNVNTYGLLLYDQSFDNIEQIKNQSYTIDPDEMARIDKMLYTYFGINEKILTNSYDEATWTAFYEGVIEPIAIALGSKLTMMLLTPTQVRKGNKIMFSSGYLEYATTNEKIKVANLMTTAGVGSRDEVRDIFQMPRVDGENALYLFRGEYYGMNKDNEIVVESGGRTNHSASGWSSYDDDRYESDDVTDDVA